MAMQQVSRAADRESPRALGQLARALPARALRRRRGGFAPSLLSQPAWHLLVARSPRLSAAGVQLSCR
eukprot:5536380-Pyramimonas_sp.AAC.1